MKKLYAIPVALVLLALVVFPAFTWDGGVSVTRDCDKVTVTADPETYWEDHSGQNQIKWVPTTVIGTGVFPWGTLQTSMNGTVYVTWRKYTSNSWGIFWSETNTYQTEHFDWSKNRPGNCKITICHVAGLASDPANYQTLTVSINAALGHFFENGTPRAGHENDSLGACNPPPSHQYGANLTITENCNGYDSTVHITDFGVDISTVAGPSGTWNEPFVLESAAINVTATLPDGTQVPLTGKADEPADCQQTHQVTWSNDPTCKGWDASYAIDGGTPVVYASGSWSEPFVLETVDVPAFDIPTNAGELYDYTQVPIQHLSEPEDCQGTHQVTWDVKPTCQGWDAFYAIDGGEPVIYASGTWSDPFVLESVDVPAFDIPTNQGEVYDHTQIPVQSIDEPKDCQQSHTTDKWFESTCSEYHYGYVLDGQNVETGSGTWNNPYAPESVSVTVNVPTNEDELYPYGTSFSFDIAKDASCIRCKREIAYPQAAYIDVGAPASYWQGPFGLGPGICTVIHPDGQTPSVNRVIVLCSLCTEQIEGGFIYNAFREFYDDYVWKVTCNGVVHYEYMGLNWDQWYKPGYKPDGTRECPRQEGCADWIKEKARITE